MKLGLKCKQANNITEKRPMTGNVINLTDYKEKNERLKVKSNLETKFQHSLK